MQVVGDSESTAAKATSVLYLRTHPSRSARDDDARASIRATRRTFATLLFVDIVDSTAHATCLGDHQWLELQAAHDDKAREAVRRFRGRVLGTVGDGLIARMPTATAGALCAARIMASTASLGLDVRIGLHAGECEQRSRQLGGLVFHVGARIAGLAAPGQILLSQTVADLTLGSGLALAPIGSHVLKGLAEPWNLYELLSREPVPPRPAA